jgi:hypothetical protein
MKKLLIVVAALALGGCVTSSEKLEAQDAASCASLLSDQPVYIQCRQNLRAYHRDAEEADSIAARRALYRFGSALSGAGDAMRTNSPSAAAIDVPRTTNCTSTRQLPNGSSGSVTCTTF